MLLQRASSCQLWAHPLLLLRRTKQQAMQPKCGLYRDVAIETQKFLSTHLDSGRQVA